MRVINIFGGPGCGKSTTAAGVFNLLKLANKRAELITEYAKDIVWDNAHALLDDCLLVIANQHHRLLRLKQHGVDYAIVDSPLPLALAYMNQQQTERYKNLVFDLFDDYSNDLYQLNRVKPYQPYGRSQTEDEAKMIDVKLNDIFLSRGKYSIITLDGDAKAAQLIASRYINNDL